MRHCFLLAQTNGDLSTERVIGQVNKISCVKVDGKNEEREVQGFLAGEDSTFGVIGQLISRQGSVLAAAAIAQLAKGASDAIATAQTLTTLVPNQNGSSSSATNVVGDQAKYVFGKALTEPASMVAQWYLKYAEELVPVIAVGSGRTIWVILQNSVEIPALIEKG